ncbi:hypothetical protein DY000_02018052 [Brassica cretica]|uniref:RNA-directed RNA polymerase n=1 Tax=Brassica cretica TaxID=69181 RepID=A0ABQ7CYL5_BRACR|nr:hypothetical protein DY000_02018052 [Brassica cretica]
MLTCSSYLTCSNQATLHSEIYLSSRVETLLNRIYSKHNHPQIKAETRRTLSSVSRELASETLRKVFNASCVKGTVDGFINYLRGQAVSSVYGSPRPCSGVSPPALSLPELLGKKLQAFSRECFIQLGPGPGLEFYGGAELKDIKRNLDAFYPQALALYNIVYDYAILKNNLRYCGFVWRVAGRVLCDFYLERKVDGEGEESFSAAGSVVKKLYG